MSQSDSCIFFCNFNAPPQELSSPPEVCLAIHFPLPCPIPFQFPSSVTFSCLIRLVAPFPFEVPASIPGLFSSPWQSSLSLSSTGRLIPLLGALGSADYTTSSFLWITSSPVSAPTFRQLPDSYCQKLGGSIVAMRFSQPYRENQSQAGVTLFEGVFSGLE